MKFESYLIEVGVRSADYTYDVKLLYSNVDYFRKCRLKGLSPYKALLFFGDYLNGDYII